MEGSQLPALLERLKTDEELRDKFLAAEKSARREATKVRARIDELAEANVAALSRIAEDAGYDISGALKRPGDYAVTPSQQEVEGFSLACVFTCCFVGTSVYSTETFAPPCVPPDAPPWMTL
ncbi:MAG TPA: hypothetical protein VH231_20870 [Solirubrobacteraceae bacterium]|nr:hypothetical protein [Solirubrobacteraceae bacterium]